MPIARDEAKTNYRDHEEILAQIKYMDSEIDQAESLLQDIHKTPSNPCENKKESVPELSSLADLLRCGAAEIKGRRDKLSCLLAEIRCALGLEGKIDPPLKEVSVARLTGHGVAVDS